MSLLIYAINTVPVLYYCLVTLLLCPRRESCHKWQRPPRMLLPLRLRDPGPNLLSLIRSLLLNLVPAVRCTLGLFLHYCTRHSVAGLRTAELTLLELWYVVA